VAPYSARVRALACQLHPYANERAHAIREAARWQDACAGGLHRRPGLLRRLLGRRLPRRAPPPFGSFADALGPGAGADASPSIVILNSLSHDQLLSLLEARIPSRPLLGSCS